jgi:hypothetical protein
MLNVLLNNTEIATQALEQLAIKVGLKINKKKIIIMKLLEYR